MNPELDLVQGEQRNWGIQGRPQLHSRVKDIGLLSQRQSKRVRQKENTNGQGRLLKTQKGLP